MLRASWCDLSVEGSAPDGGGTPQFVLNGWRDACFRNELLSLDPA